MKQGNRGQGSRGVSDGQAGSRSGKPSRRGGAQDSVSAARRSLGKQGKRNELGKQGSQHALREDGHPCEGANADAGRRGSKKTHGSGRPQGASKSNAAAMLSRLRQARKARMARVKRAHRVDRAKRRVRAVFPQQRPRPSDSSRKPLCLRAVRSCRLAVPIWRSAVGTVATSCSCAAMRTSTIPRSAWPSSRACLRPIGYKVGVICQPDWRDPESVTVLGRPRAGIPGFRWQHGLDGEPLHGRQEASQHSMRSRPAARWGFVPIARRWSTATLIRRTYKDVPIVLGGIEASLRRLGALRLLVGQAEALDPA